jgi:hypothetical protein
MIRTIFLFVVLLSFVSAVAAQNLKADLDLMMKWFEGRFDNHQQTVEEKEARAEFPHEHIHSIFARVKMPQIGENVFFVQQYMDGDASKIYRQRLYVFSPNAAEKAIELKIYTFPDEKATRDAHLDQTKLVGLTLDKLDSPKGCEVYWRLNGDKFEGSMKKDACRVVSKRSGKTLVITDDLFLTKDEIWINDQAKDDAGNYVFGNKSGIHHKLKKVRMFEGWTAVTKDGSIALMNADPPAEAYDGKRGLTVHDQGEKVKINETYSIQLAKLKHRSGLEVLTLGVIENATGKKVAYAWAEADAERIGINLRWVQAGFTLKK